MLINYLIPTRIYRHFTQGDQIQQWSKQHLPVPYSPDELLIEKRASVRFPEAELMIGDPARGKLSEYRDKILDLYERKYAFFAGAEAVTLYGFDVFRDFSSVDSYVYETMERLTSHQLDSFSDLSNKIADYQHNFWGGLSDHGLSKFGGHMGEVYAANHLAGLGADIQWPAASNQPGWDLLVNGHEVNVKLVADYSGLSEHFSRYPDIPVIIPGDAAHIPDYAVHLDSTSGISDLMTALSAHPDHLVISDDLLSHDTVMAHAQQATDTLLGSPDMVSFHIPLVTILFSGWREAHLLLNDRTDALSSMKNLSLDVTGTGGGGFLGAKTGALIGTAIFPGIGTGIGALLGAIGGAMTGRHVTNKMKRESLDRALAHYQRVEAEWQSRLQRETEQFVHTVQELQDRQQTLLNEVCSTEKESLHRTIRDMKHWRTEQQEVPVSYANDMLLAAAREMKELLNELRGKLGWQGWLQRTFNPSLEQLALERAVAKLLKAQRSLNTYRKSIQNRVFLLRAELYAVMAGYGVQYRQIAEDVRGMETRITQDETDLRTHMNQAQGRLLELRIQTIKQFAQTLNELKAETHHRMAPFLEKMSAAAEQVKIQARKIGLEA